MQLEEFLDIDVTDVTDVTDEDSSEFPAHNHWHGERTIQFLERLSLSWERRAAVKKPELNVAHYYDHFRPDFLVELLPFGKHPDFQRLPEHIKQKILSCGWLAYNEKTIAIESKIVNPACMHVIDGDLPKLNHYEYRSTASQAQVDESYHILLVLNSCRVTRQQRDLLELKIPQFQLVQQMHRIQDQHPERWKKILIQMAWAIVSEVLVSDYLSLLSGEEAIQPLNRLTTEIHRRDEAAHNAVFKSIGAALFHSLGCREQQFFLSALAEPARWFGNAELEIWRSMLHQINCPNADRIIDDSFAENRQQTVHLDLTTLEKLYQDLGVSGPIQT